MLRKPRFYFFGGLILVLLAGALALIASKFLKYRNAGLQGLQNAPQALVAITSPRPFSQLEASSPILVQVAAAGYQPLVSAELWVDGTLMGVQTALPGGQSRLQVTFLWSPGPAGEHSLMARTVDADGGTVVSTPVLVEILPSDADPGPAAVLPGASGENPAPGLPGPDEAVGPAQAGPPSPANWLLDLSVSESPAAPELAVSLQGCAVTLNIHDLSNNEEGFQVFRSLDNAPGWTEIAALGSQSALDWLTYPDDLAGLGGASYYAAAVNGAGQAQSNLAAADVSPADCPPKESDQQFLFVEPVGLHIDGSVDQAYCYRSLGGLYWERWPETGFFLPGADGFDVQQYELAFALNGLDGGPVIETLDLYVECWGWTGGVLKDLGEIHFESADLFDLGPQGQEGGIFAMDLNFKIGIYDPYARYKLYSPPESPQLPFVVAWLTYDPQQCVAHLLQQFQNALGALLFCAPRPGYTLGPGTANPQPYLVWTTMDHTCPAGFNDECWSLAALLEDAEKYDGNVFFLRQVHYGGNYAGYTTEGAFTVDVAGGFCPGTELVTVQLKYIRPDTGLISGPESNEVSIPCNNAPLGDSVAIDVTFDSLTLSSVDDDDGDGPDDVEVYGTFQAASTDGSHGIRNLAYWSDHLREVYECPDEAFYFAQSLNTVGSNGCPHNYPNGSYQIASMNLCTSDYVESCVVNYSEGTDFLTNNNTIHLTVGDGDHLLIQVLLIDEDSGSADDAVCFGVLNLPAKTKFQWANTVSEAFTISQGNNGHAACTVHGTIGVAP